MSEERLKIAVFIDFDNIEIGVKKTLSKHFDVGTVLEAIKERGEVVTKIAYGDWKRAADYSHAMTQHAVHMVQRNLTPGGDKNGADITLALDALEMAFTRVHINAFVIVGGDSDFIALVEKLKQYDKMVFVVGGRSFTSSILQKNCHEFIAYENLIGIRPAARKAAGRAPSPSTAHMRDALPQLRRALEILADREVSPQLGLLKSTLLQLDSTFSERDYGARSFREFIQKMADAGYVTLKDVDGSLLVEMKYAESVPAPAPAPAPEAGNAQVPEADEPPPREPAEAASHQADALSIVRRIVEESGSKAHWPMYLRSFRHFLRAGDPSFDERRYGFGSTHDLVRQAQREGMLRVERNRQGILRIFPPEIPPPQVQDAGSPEPDVALQPAVIPSIEEAAAADQIPPPETPAAAPEAVPEDISLQGALRFAEGPVVEEKPRRRRSARTPSAAGRRKPAARRLKAAKQDSEPA